jgi:hypothetical protein
VIVVSTRAATVSGVGARSAPLSRPRAFALVGAVLVAHAGLAHEVIGARLYPDGPALLGGPIPWYALGLSGVAAGILMACGVLGLVAVPLAPLGIGVSIIGALFVVMDVVVHHGFHFFAFTMVVAGMLVARGDARG